ncbi:MAG: HNH endonuclease signature motif containing protein, partial [Candidatus Krumholzibacteriales bacterium]
VLLKVTLKVMKEYYHEDCVVIESWMYSMAEKSNSSSEKLIGFFPLFLPFGMGGDNSPENLRLLCGRHNRLMAEREYGRDKIREIVSGTTDT